MPVTFTNPRVAAKHAKREANKRKAIEKRKREKENKELRKVLGNPQKLFDELQEAKAEIARLTASVNEHAVVTNDAMHQCNLLRDRVTTLKALEAGMQKDIELAWAERNAAKAMLDAKERNTGYLPLAKAYLDLQKLNQQVKDLLVEKDQILGTVARLTDSEASDAKVMEALRAEIDGLRVDLADALGQPARAGLTVTAAPADTPVHLPIVDSSVPELQAGDEAEA